LIYRRLLFAAFYIACAASAAHAQQPQPPAPCKLTLEQSPALRGFRLGMSVQQLRERLPGIAVTEDASGLTIARFTPFDFKSQPVGYEGINDINFSFLDDRLVALWVGYDNRVEWQSVGQFASRVSELLKLPDAWREESGGARRTMDCAGFQIAVSPNQISLMVSGLNEETSRRRQQRDEERRRKFKP
jgi:hypothetical protein